MDIDRKDTIIIGAGLSGLSAAHFLKKQDSDHTILILERENRSGGSIQSVIANGYLAELGPHGFLDNVEESVELLRDLKIERETLNAPLKTFKRYICLNGKLNQLPQSPPTALKTDLIPLTAKFRLLADLWIKPESGEQTVADWVSQRFGKAMLPFADIAMTGTYAGDIHKLSIDAVMPGLRKLEIETGSLLRGLRNQRKKKKRTHIPTMISFKNGVEYLIRKLSTHQEIRYNSTVIQVIKDSSGWTVQTNKEIYHSRNLIVALHINQSLPILNHLRPTPYPSVRESNICNVLLGFKSDAEIPFGFGYLTPASEKRFALGALFPTHMFGGRAPEGEKTLEVLVGGSRHPEHLNLTDRELIEQSYNDVRQLIHLPSPPVFSNVLRTKRGIPQLELGYGKLLRYRDELKETYPSLFVCGFGWNGIGMNEMITQAKHVATALTTSAQRDDTPIVKGIYF